MLDIPLQLVTCNVSSVSATKGEIEGQTFHLVHFAENLMKGDYTPNEHR